jgi:hypothetical protein
MSTKPVSMTREALYELVWAEPIVQIAKRLGMSDRGLGKLCARLEIPAPPRGWWAKQQHGKRVRRQPLPPSRKGQPTQVTFQTGQQFEPPAPTPEYEREKRADWRIEVPADLKITNRLLKSAAVALRRSAREGKRSLRWQDRYRQLLVGPVPGSLNIAVSKEAIPRALRIMQALLHAFKRRNFPISVTESGQTVVRVLDEPIEIALTERLRRPTAPTHRGAVNAEPSGRLILRAGPSYSNSGSSDGVRHRIEDQLNRFVAGLVRQAVKAKDARVAAEDRARRWEAHDLAERQELQKADSEAMRQERFADQAEKWARHQRLLEFVRAMEQHALRRPTESQEKKLADCWTSWAKELLNELDPAQTLLIESWPSAPMRPARSVPWNWQ